MRASRRVDPEGNSFYADLIAVRQAVHNQVEAGHRAQALLATTGWWRWRNLDAPDDGGWIHRHREQRWTTFYGRLSVP